MPAEVKHTCTHKDIFTPTHFKDKGVGMHTRRQNTVMHVHTQLID